MMLNESLNFRIHVSSINLNQWETGSRDLPKRLLLVSYPLFKILEPASLRPIQWEHTNPWHPAKKYHPAAYRCGLGSFFDLSAVGGHFCS